MLGNALKRVQRAAKDGTNLINDQTEELPKFPSSPLNTSGRPPVSPVVPEPPRPQAITSEQPVQPELLNKLKKQKVVNNELVETSKATS